MSSVRRNEVCERAIRFRSPSNPGVQCRMAHDRLCGINHPHACAMIFSSNDRTTFSVTIKLVFPATLLLLLVGVARESRPDVIKPERDRNGIVVKGFWENLPTNRWIEIADTQLISDAPDPAPPGTGGVKSTVDGYSGAAFDTKRESLLIWGGGNSLYAGNEIYAFSVPQLKFSRLWGPSPVGAMQGDPKQGWETYNDGNPGARATYGGLAYAANADAFFSVSGALYPTGGASAHAWQFALQAKQWTGPIAGVNPAYGTIAEYDPVSGHVFSASHHSVVQEYDPLTRRFVASHPGGPFSYVSSSTVIPKRRIMLVLGAGKLASFNFDTKKYQVLSVSGETRVVKPLVLGPYDFYYAGFVYAEDLDLLLVWDNNGSLFSIDPNTWRIQKLNITGVPPGKPVNGMAGRMRYVPSKSLLVLVTNARRNVYAVKLGRPLPLAAVSAPPSGPRIVVRGKTFTSVNAAAGYAKDGDLVEIAATTYREDGAAWPQNNLTLRGVGGRAHMEAGAIEGKGIWVIKGKNVTVENIEFSNASVSDRNGAGIRHEGEGLTVRNCYFRNNENGILTNANPESKVVIENSEFSGNGDGSGQTHNMYIGKIKSFTLRGSYSHHARVGHNVKSRALTNYILYNRVMDEATGTASYAIDLPSGGISYVIGNLIQQGPLAENSGIVSYGAEKTTNPVNELYMINNTIVNDLDKGTFLYINPATQKVKVMNNIFAGPGKLPEGDGISSNLHLNKSDLADPMHYDYHLKLNSAAIGTAVDPGTANGFALQPLYEYTNGAPPLPRAKLKSLDVGAFQYRLQTAPRQR